MGLLVSLRYEFVSNWTVLERLDFDDDDDDDDSDEYCDVKASVIDCIDVFPWIKLVIIGLI